MLDPGSVVREGEFATAQNAASVPSQVVNVYNRVLTGERLNPVQRNDFTGQSANIYNSVLSNQSQLEEQFTGLARRAGFRPEDIVIPFQQPSPTSQDVTNLTDEEILQQLGN